ALQLASGERDVAGRVARARKRRVAAHALVAAPDIEDAALGAVEAIVHAVEVAGAAGAVPGAEEALAGHDAAFHGRVQPLLDGRALPVGRVGLRAGARLAQAVAGRVAAEAVDAHAAGALAHATAARAQVLLGEA